jgi:hypothetical protein
MGAELEPLHWAAAPGSPGNGLQEAVLCLLVGFDHSRLCARPTKLRKGTPAEHEVIL